MRTVPEHDSGRAGMDVQGFARAAQRSVAEAVAVGEAVVVLDDVSVDVVV